MKPISKSILFVTASVIFLLITTQSARATPKIWDGSTSTDWGTGTNWSGDAAPLSTDDAVIPDATTTPNDPSVSAGAVCNNLTINSGGILNNNSNTLTVSGSWSNSGTFNSGFGSSVTFNGTGAGKTINPGSSSFFNLTINSSDGTGYWTITTNNLSVYGLTVTNGTLDTGTRNLSASNGGVSLNGGDLVGGSGTISTSSLSISNSSSTFTASSAVTISYQYIHSAGTADWLTNSSTLTLTTGGGSQTLPADTYYNLALNAGTPADWSLSSGTTTVNGYLNIGIGHLLVNDKTLTVLGNITLSNASSSLVVTSGAINCGGNWTITAGTFTAGTGTVTFNGTNQSILGSSTFYNLTKSISGTARTLTFGDDTTQTISAGGTLTLNGATGAILSLRTVSDNGTAKFNIDDDGSESVSYVNVKDGTAVHSITATYSVDAGGNTNWVFDSLIVITTADTVTPGTLRYALTYALAGQTIYFDTTVFPPGTPSTITVASTALPSITQGTLTVYAADAGVIIDGNGLGAGIDGLTLASTGNTIKGLRIKSFPDDGIVITSGDNTIGGTASNEGNMIYSNGDNGIDFSAASGTTTILGNYIGTNSSYTDLGNALYGIYVNGQGTLTIGGTAAGAANVIAWQDNTSSDAGIYVDDGSPTIQGNYIGTNSSGAALGNYTGIYLKTSADNVTIGGTTASAANVIGLNTTTGIWIGPTTAVTVNVQGNYVGTDSSWRNLDNGSTGIYSNSTATVNIGGTDTGAGNWICCQDDSGNSGIYVMNGSPTIQGNYIGTNASGAALGNYYGIFLSPISDNVTIGGTVAGAANVIGKNIYRGIHIGPTSAVTVNVQGNYIGTNSSGTDLGNGTGGTTTDYCGIYAGGTATVNIGGTDAGAGNVIAWQDNTSNCGIYVYNGSPTIQGNYIGINASGAALGNYYGIYLGTGADSVTIGGTASGAGNTISMNKSDGINSASTATGIVVQGNYIGTNASSASLPNAGDGIETTAGTITIGNASETVSNVIGPNTGYGIYLSSGTPTVNLAGTVTVNDDIYIAAGTFNLQSATLQLSGNWSNSGTFTCGTGTVTLDGTNQSLTGSTTFYNLTKNVTTAYTLTFDNTATQTITNSLTLNGAVGQLLSLRSDSPTDQFSLTLQAGGTQNLSYLDVKDSYASDGQTLAAGATSINSLNNNNWTFEIISVVLRNAGDTGDYTTWVLGSGKEVDTVYLMDTDTGVLVKNDGNVSEDFSIQITDTTNWTVSTDGNNDVNKAVFMGLFNGNSAPGAGDFNILYDLILTTVKWATTSGDDGNYEGVLNDGDNVVAGSGEKLYIYLKTPSSVTSGLPETITVTIGSREHTP